MGVTTNPKSAALEVMDEGVTITDRAASMDFTNTGVTASAVGDDVTVDVPGNPAATTQVVGEEMNATGDPLVFTIDFLPVDEPRIFIGAGRVFDGLTRDYTRVGLTFTFNYTPQTTPTADYAH